MKDSQEFREQCKERLKKIIGKKIETAMIYPLSQFEAAFGHRWGHGLPIEKLTDEQLVDRRKWDEVRSNILTNGNQQKRNAYAELNMHDVLWKRYNATLIPVPSVDSNVEEL